MVATQCSSPRASGLSRFAASLPLHLLPPTTVCNSSTKNDLTRRIVTSSENGLRRSSIRLELGAAITEPMSKAITRLFFSPCGILPCDPRAIFGNCRLSNTQGPINTGLFLSSREYLYHWRICILDRYWIQFASWAKGPWPIVFSRLDIYPRAWSVYLSAPLNFVHGKDVVLSYADKRE